MQNKICQKLELVIEWVEIYVVRICQTRGRTLEMWSELVREEVELYLGGQNLWEYCGWLSFLWYFNYVYLPAYNGLLCGHSHRHVPLICMHSLAITPHCTCIWTKLFNTYSSKLFYLMYYFSFRSFMFHHVTLVDALREFLESFRLPGEAPVISGIMEKFSAHWLVMNTWYTS